MTKKQLPNREVYLIRLIEGCGAKLFSKHILPFNLANDVVGKRLCRFGRPGSFASKDGPLLRFLTKGPTKIKQSNDSTPTADSQTDTSQNPLPSESTDKESSSKDQESKAAQTFSKTAENGGIPEAHEKASGLDSPRVIETGKTPETAPIKDDTEQSLNEGEPPKSPSQPAPTLPPYAELRDGKLKDAVAVMSDFTGEALKFRSWNQAEAKYNEIAAQIAQQ